MVEMKCPHSLSIMLLNDKYFIGKFLNIWPCFPQTKLGFRLFFLAEEANVCLLLSLVFYTSNIVSLTKFSVLHWMSFGTREPPLFSNKLSYSRINMLYLRNTLSLLLKVVLIFIGKYDKTLQRSEHFFFLIFFALI